MTMGAKPCSIEVSPYRSRWNPAYIVIVICVVVITTLLIAVVALALIRLTPPHCAAGRNSKGRDMDSPGLFNDLTPAEMRAVRDYLLSVEQLGLKRVETATVNSSYIFMIDLQVPLKAAVLDFIDNGRRRPGRAAIAVIYRGDIDPPRVEEHIVGPLPRPTYHRLVTNPAYRRTPIPFASRPMDAVERRELRAFLKRETAELYELLMESYDLNYHNCTQGVDCMLLVDLPPRGIGSGKRRSWFWGYRQVEGASLHPLGFALQVDHAYSDVSKWRIVRVVYNGQLFYELEDLMERYREETIRRVRLVMDQYDQGFSSYKRRGPQRFDVPGQGPKSVEPDGKRFTVDGQFVEYFGWSFNFRSRLATGIQLIDVNFQGGRIAYEIGLQEAAVFYSGHGAEVSSLAFYATSWLIGASSYELVPGVDCPATAAFLDAFHFFDGDSPRRYRRSVCLFEQNSGTPLRRHFAHDPEDGFMHYGGVVSNSLVLRTIAVIWNKDFIFDYVFHLDGTLEIRVFSTGYLQASFSLPRERPYGHYVHDDVIGNIYQDLFHFKIDLDVGDKVNRYEKLELYAEEEPNFWYPSLNITKMRFRRTVVKTEKESVWKFASGLLQHHIIYNHKMFNRYRSHRGYRILHMSPTDFVLKDASVGQAAGWATYPLVVTKYKDVEDASSSIYAQGDPWDPVVDFRMYLEDNNTIVDDDLVVWATLGSTVVPRAEDVPSPTTTLNAYTLLLSPFNYFDHCPSTVVSDAVHLTKGREAGGKVVVDTFGTTDGQQPSCLQQENTFHDFNGHIEVMAP